jgi:2,3-diaminopropionate biosynthesis protein SbnB
MREGDLLIFTGDEVSSILASQELELIKTVRMAYETHAKEKSSLPYSTFLRFPNDPNNRIIALPAYLGDEFDVAGIKWIASFPHNLERGLDRASAIVILNSMLTGRPKAIMEGSIISAKRTAASAALAAQLLHNGENLTELGLIGCGLINFEIVRFALAIFPNLKKLVAFDKNINRANSFKYNVLNEFGKIEEVEIAIDVNIVLREVLLVSIATNALKSHINDISICNPGTTLLHISLRDIDPKSILSCDNIVDDIDHICRANTSIHLAEQLVKNRDFIRCSIADITRGLTSARKDINSVTVFNPFGLGILDIAVGNLVYDLGLNQGLGTTVESFLPNSLVKKPRIND